MQSNMDLINDMFGDCNLDENYDIEFTCNNKEYYIGKAHYIIDNIPNNDIYYEFLKVILSKYNELNKKQIEELNNIMNIKEKIVYKEKIVIKNNLSNKKKKPKLNCSDL